MSERISHFWIKSTILRILLLFAVAIPSFPLSLYGQADPVQSKIELKSWVDQSEVPFNRELTFIVEASWEGEQDRFSITPVTPPKCKKFEILASSSVNETKREEEKIKSLKTFKFTLKPTETGEGRIGSIELSYVDNLTQDSSSLSTQPIQVQVTPPIKERGSEYKTVLLIVILMILAYVVWSAIRRKRGIEIAEDKKTEKPPSGEESLEDRSLKELKAITERVQKGELKSFSSDIYKLLTGYLETKYQIPTTGKTTDDILKSLSGTDLASERIQILKEIFSTCDLMKFAKDKLEKGKCDQITAQVRKFVEQNQ